MKKFRNSYAAYMLLYSFYFMSTSLFTTLISVYLMGKHYSATQVSTLVSVAFFLSMVAQPFFGYINERFGIVKMTTLSLSIIIGGVLGSQSLLADSFLWNRSSLFEWNSSHDGSFCNAKSLRFWEDSRLGNDWLLSWSTNSRLGLSSV